MTDFQTESVFTSSFLCKLGVQKCCLSEDWLLREYTPRRGPSKRSRVRTVVKSFLPSSNSYLDHHQKDQSPTGHSVVSHRSPWIQY